MSKNIMYVDKDFRLYLESLRKEYKTKFGIDLTFPQLTRLATQKLKNTGFNGELEELTGKRQKRYFKLEL